MWRAAQLHDLPRTPLIPPAANPDGVAVRLRSKSTGNITELVNGQDFTVDRNSEGLGTSVKLNAIPTADQEVELFFVLQKEPRADPLVGACATSTTP